MIVPLQGQEQKLLSAFLIKSDGAETRKDSEKAQDAGADFLSLVLGTQLPGPGMKIKG